MTIASEELVELWSDIRVRLERVEPSATDADLVAALLTIATVLGRIELELEGPFVRR